MDEQRNIPFHTEPKYTEDPAILKLKKAVRKAAEETETVRKYAASIYKKLATIILDPSGSYGKEKFTEMIDKTGERTLIEAIISLCDRLNTGDIYLDYDMIINALGFIPSPEAGSNYVVGIFLDD